MDSSRPRTVQVKLSWEELEESSRRGLSPPHLIYSLCYLSSLLRTRTASSESYRLWIKPMATVLGFKSSEAWRP